MGKLQKKQSEFARKVALLVLYANQLGYEITFGSAYISPAFVMHTGHKNNGLHPKRLAIDLNLFKDGVWLEETEDHKPLGEFWESMPGCTWGGRYGDGNHYSMEHGGWS